MTNPLTEEQLQAIIDGCETAINTGRHGDWREGMDPATVKVMATLALQSLDREGVRVEDVIRAGWEHGRNSWCPAGILADHARTEREWNEARPGILSTLSPQPETAKEPADAWNDGYTKGWNAAVELHTRPETAKEVGETEEMAYLFTNPKFGKELAFLKDVAGLEARHGWAMTPLYAHPAPQSPPAPVVDEALTVTHVLRLLSIAEQLVGYADLSDPDAQVAWAKWRDQKDLVSRLATAALEGRS